MFGWIWRFFTDETFFVRIFRGCGTTAGTFLITDVGQQMVSAFVNAETAQLIGVALAGGSITLGAGKNGKKK